MDGVSESVIQALREQGFEIHESVMSTEGMIYGVRSTAASACGNRSGDQQRDYRSGHGSTLSRGWSETSLEKRYLATQAA